MCTKYNIKPVKVPSFIISINNIDERNLKKFERPEHYISYSEKDSNCLEEFFELSNEDFKFLNALKYTEEEQFKKIIAILEEESHEKGSKVTFSQVEDKFKTIFPNLKQNAHQKIFKFWKDERKRRKRSYMRKYWKTNLLNDRYIEMSFNGNEADKTLLRKKRFISQPLEIYEKLKEVKSEFEEFVLPLIKLIKEKENKNREVFKLDNDNFNLVRNVLQERYKVIEIPNVNKTTPIKKILDPIEFLDTAQSIEDEESKEEITVRHKKQKESKKNVIVDNQKKEADGVNKNPFKCNSISSKYIKDIVSKKIFGSKNEGSPIKKKYKFKKENETTNQDANIKTETKKEDNITKNKDDDVEKQEDEEDEEEDLTIIVDKSLVANYLDTKKMKYKEVEKNTFTDFSQLQKKLKDSDFFHQSDKYSSVFLGKKYRPFLPSDLEEIMKIQKNTLKEWRKSIINII
jgi:hypothetical protein